MTLSFPSFLHLLLAIAASLTCEGLQVVLPWRRGSAVASLASTASSSASSVSLLPYGLNLTTHEDLLTPSECETIMSFARPYLHQARVGLPPKVEPSLRLSFGCKLPRLPIPELWEVEQKLADAAGVPVECGEDLQVGCYPVGHYYGMHCDERKGGRPNGGGRLATALAYLNDLDPAKVTGGHTAFSGKPFDLAGEPDFPVGDKRIRELKRVCDCNDMSAVRVAPKQGRVITFRNLAPVSDGTGDVGGGAWRFITASTHGACPVVNTTNPPATGLGAEKHVVQQWFGLESDVSVARHPQLLAHIGLGIANNFNISPFADLASPNGEPFATASHGSTVSTSAMIPHLGATTLRGLGARIYSKGQPGALQSGTNGTSAALWISLGQSESQRLFRVGPHELWIKSGELQWSVGESTARFVTSPLLVNQWHHVAITISPPLVSSDDSVTLRAALYLNVPGQPPCDPTRAVLSGLDGVPEWIEGVSIGGTRRGTDEGEVDLTAADFYAISKDMTGRGQSFAFALTHGILVSKDGDCLNLKVPGSVQNEASTEK